MLFHLLKLNLKPLPTDEEEAGPPVATRKGVLVGGLVLAAVAAGGVVVGRVSCHQSSTAGSMSISSPAGSAVAVVGNGMLTDEDRRLIDTFDEVAGGEPSDESLATMERLADGRLAEQRLSAL